MTLPAWREYRDFCAWRAHRDARAIMLSKLHSIELVEYSLEYCLARAAALGVSPEDIGVIGAAIFERCGRGKMTMKDAIALIRPVVPARPFREPTL